VKGGGGGVRAKFRSFSNKEGKKKRKEWLLYAHTHRSVLGAAGHIILTPANQLRLWGSKYGHCPIRVSNHRPFDHWSNVLTTALTGPTRKVRGAINK
jgi:hypothetical protein